jgi:NADH-quinone oxidoreductase subunit L
MASGITAAVGIYLAWTFKFPFSESIQNWVKYIGVPVEINVDGLSVLLTAFVGFLSFVIILYAASNMTHEKNQARFYSLVLVFVGAMLGLVAAGNLIQFYFFWEIVGICSALLIAFWTDKEAARKAGFKAFVITRFGDIALFIAVILTLTTIHTTNINSIISTVSTQGGSPTWTFIGVLVFIGAMGKSAQVPLHGWLPDAMEGPTPVSALIHAATMVNAGVYLVVRLYPIFTSSVILLPMVLSIGALSMIVGAVCAVGADDIKRVLAYSTISQLGLMFVAIGLGSATGAIDQLISQGLFKALAFMAAGSVIEATGTRNIDEMGGLRVMKYTYLAFLFAVLAMVGLPPLIGFWTKDAILSAAVSSNTAAFWVLLLGFILTSFYSFRVFIKVFHTGPVSDVKESPPLMVLPMMVLVVSVVVGWFVLAYQTLLPTPGEVLGVLSSSASLSALFAGLAISYVAFVARAEATRRLMQANNFLRRSKGALLEGLGFDRFYAAVARGTSAVARAASEIQTGILGVNIALMLAALILLILLTAIGVI